MRKEAVVLAFLAVFGLEHVSQAAVWPVIRQFPFFHGVDTLLTIRDRREEILSKVFLLDLSIYMASNMPKGMPRAEAMLLVAGKMLENGVHKEKALDLLEKAAAELLPGKGDKRNSLLGKAVMLLAANGRENPDLEKALPKRQAEALLVVKVELACRRGDSEGARAALEKITDRLLADKARSAMTGHFAKKGMLAEAVDELRLTGNVLWLLKSFGYVAAGMAAAGQCERLAGIIEELAFARQKSRLPLVGRSLSDSLLLESVLACAEAGDAAGAARYLAMIKDQSARIQAMLEMKAPEAEKLKLLAEASAGVSQIEEPGKRARELMRLASIYLNADDGDSAGGKTVTKNPQRLALARDLVSKAHAAAKETDRTNAFSPYFSTLKLSAELGGCAEAAAEANLIIGTGIDASIAPASAALGCLEAGDETTALELLQRIQDRDWKNKVFAATAFRRASIGQWSESLGFVQGLSGVLARIDALCMLGIKSVLEEHYPNDSMRQTMMSILIDFLMNDAAR